jgi:hypothetical protein
MVFTKKRVAPKAVLKANSPIKTNISGFLSISSLLCRFVTNRADFGKELETFSRFLQCDSDLALQQFGAAAAHCGCEFPLQLQSHSLTRVPRFYGMRSFGLNSMWTLFDLICESIQTVSRDIAAQQKFHTGDVHHGS